MTSFILEPDPQQADWSQRAGTLCPAGPAPDVGQSEQSSSSPTQRDEKEAGRVRLQGLDVEERAKENGEEYNKEKRLIDRESMIMKHKRYKHTVMRH